MTSHKLGQVFETMMEKRQIQIPSEGFYEKIEKRSRQRPKCRNIVCGYAEHWSNSKGKRIKPNWGPKKFLSELKLGYTERAVM
jgi:hypothetical protein